MTELYQDVIALLTDFGPMGQHYIASMKAVILKINPNVKIIDISHTVSSYSILEASYLIKSTYIHFPEYTVFVIVIDPGVGSSREIVAFRTKGNYFFVGPNNGIFSNVFSEHDIEECVLVKNENYFNKPVSNTFHGRDIMAPIGANISNGIPLSNFGPFFDPEKFKKFPLVYEILPEKGIINCIVQYIDSFGNATTNIALNDDLIVNSSFKIKDGERYDVKYKNKLFEGIFTSHFANVPLNSLLFLKGSSGFLEISINQGNAAEHIGFKVGDIISFVSK
ncbi:MAG: S-adenosyl-l-methionine hydroxide adenosyltransferase family protein [Candidatus Hermodarchaeota archaeon]